MNPGLLAQLFARSNPTQTQGWGPQVYAPQEMSPLLEMYEKQQRPKKKAPPKQMAQGDKSTEVR